ncbi:radical SAM protein [Candidatus Woesearchaeota archaeon]|nr:radical SAM protein [Candidatus Woesearchaeota archaeon]
MQNILIKVNRAKKVHFERAIFISWYCSLGDCTYCYMSTQKGLISDPKKAKRSTASILAEAYLCRKLGWKLGNLAAGYGSYTHESILELVKQVYEIYGGKFWLNIGVLPEKTIAALKPYLEGLYGAVETTNEKVHEIVAPNKPIRPIENMFKICEKYNLKKAMTFIVGMGETIDDFQSLKEFIAANKVDKVVFYALNPIEGTMFEDSKGPGIDYYLEWMRKTRENFPDMDIVAGPWVNRIGHISSMLNAGAGSITKFPAIKLFNTRHAKTIEEEIKNSGYILEGTFTKMPKIDFEEIKKLDMDETLKNNIVEKLGLYLKKMKKTGSLLQIKVNQES